MNVHDAAFDFLPHAIGKIAVGIFKCLRNSEMLFERDLALHGHSLAASSTFELCHLLRHAPVRCDLSRQRRAATILPLYYRSVSSRSSSGRSTSPTRAGR